MLPIGDIIPTRTPPVATIALIAVSVVAASLLHLDGIVSLLVNMLYLWLFGWTVEDRLGHVRFALLYAAAALTAWWLSTPSQAVAGAVGGVLGAYFTLYPRSFILVFIPVPLSVTEVPAVVFLALWVLVQIVLDSMVGPFAAFAVGALLCRAIRRRQRLAVEWWSP